MTDDLDTTSHRPRPDGDAVLEEQVAAGQRADRRLATDLHRTLPRRSETLTEYVTSLRGTPSASASDELDIVRAAQSGDPAARARVVERFMPLIAATTRTYRSGQVQRQELLQEGVVGLLRALERYDPGREVPFWAYAGWWVRQAMQQLVSEVTHPTVLSDRALRHLSRLKQAHRDAMRQTGHEPGRDELASRTGMDTAQVDDLLAVGRTPRSLHEPVTGRDGELGTFGELLVDPVAEDAYEQVLDHIQVEELHGLLAGLSPRERTVLRARYGLDGPERTLRDVGEQLGLSGERVRQIEHRALAKLSAVLRAP